MNDQNSYLFLNREHAAQQLISRLDNFRNRNCSIIAISNGAIVIANHVARRLDADLVFMPIKRIKDPADSLRSIGVVGIDYSITDDLQRDIPQNYIYRQTRALRSELLSKYSDVYSAIHSKLQNKIVILIDDLAETSDEILGCLRIIRKQEPEEIIVAVPVIAQSAVHRVMREADSVISIHVASEDSIKSTYLDFDVITDEKVHGLMNLSNTEIIENKFLNHN